MKAELDETQDEEGADVSGIDYSRYMKDFIMDNKKITDSKIEQVNSFIASGRISGK